MPLILALVVLVAVLLGWWAVTQLVGGGGDVALPPGFTITAGADSEGGGGRGETLGELIAAAVPGENEGFQASIAILSLENQTGDTVFDTLGDGMVDELFTRLSRIRGLKVISRQSVQELEGSTLTLAEVADTLGVDHLLRGRAYPYEEAARIQVELLQAEGERVLWGNDYSLDRTNQMRAVEEISEEVGTALLEVVPALSLRSSPRTTESPGYLAYRAGSRLLNTRTRDGLIRSIDAFQSAINLDGTLALAYAGLSSAYSLSVTYRYSIGVDAYAASGLALRAAEESLRLDPELAEAYAARGYISSVALAPAQSVLADFTQAYELQPNAPNVASWLANLLVREGYYDEALAEAQRAVDLDPLSPPRRTALAYEALRARDYNLAMDQARTALSLEPEVILPRYIQGLALLLSGRAEECLELDLGPHAGLRAICLHALGRVEQATAIADSLRTALQAGGQIHPEFTNVIPAGDLAAYLAWTGNPERALSWIHRAYALSPSGIDPRVLESGLFEDLLGNAAMRREVAEIRDRIWARVQREEAEAGTGRLGRGNR
ncbi:hypothetical protein ACFL0I_02580 [Gemmatimonadota bacterium]